MSPEQIAYVRSQREAGLTDDDIFRVLIDHGYGAAQITALLEAASESASDAIPVAAEVSHTPAVEPILMPSVGGFISQSFTKAFARPDVLLYVVLIYGFLSFMVNVVPGLVGPTDVPGDIIKTVFSFINPIVTSIVFLTVMYVMLQSERVSFAAGYSWVARNFFSLLWVSLLSMLLTVAGLMFLVVPGLVLSVYILLSIPVRMQENVRGLNALVRSTQLVHGTWWSVAWRQPLLSLLIGCIMLAANVALTLVHATTDIDRPFLQVVISVLSGISVPIVAAGIAILYAILASQKPVFDAQKPTQVRTLYKALFGICIALVLFGVYAMVQLTN